MIGTKLGPYEITSKLGEGGMGEVYRATDSKLRREVAIKVLPQRFAADVERLSRMGREAQLLAQLNHPRIASIFGLEESGEIRALVMELVEGPTLAERIAEGALPIDECLGIAQQIAEGLQAAHERGIVHRDLKPANIKIDGNGEVKVLDFGLAKAMDPVASGVGSPSATALELTPTVTLGATTEGTILGTAAYMAPEQAKGLAVDQRADLWSLGVLCYEMLTGTRLFSGDSVQDTLAAVLRTEIDFDALPARTPPALRRLLRRCLERKPKQRLHHAGDARIVLDELLSGEWEEREVSPTFEPTSSRVPWIALLLLLVVVAWALREGFAPEPTPRRVERFFVEVPGMVESRGIPPFDISADAETIVWIEEGESNHLVLRSLDAWEPRQIPGTDMADGAIALTPDAASVLFTQSDGWVKRIQLAGGSPVGIAPLERSTATAGTDLSDDGLTLVYGEFLDGGPSIRRVVLDRGEPETLLPRVPGVAFPWPSFLPGDDAILFFSVAESGLGPTPGQGTVEVLRLDTRERVVLLQEAGYPSYLEGGFVVAVDKKERLVVFPIDPETYRRTGPALPIALGLQPHVGTTYRLHPGGTLAILRGLFEKDNTLVWVDRQGRETSASDLDGLFSRVRLSPNGREALVQLDRSGYRELWRLDLDRDILSPILQGNLGIFGVTWSPDGERFAVMVLSFEDNHLRVQIYRKEGGGEPTTIWEQEKPTSPFGGWSVKSWSRKGLLALDGWAGKKGVYLLAVDGSRELERLPGPSDDDYDPFFSPDGDWILFVSRRSGNSEIYLQRLGDDVAFRVSDRGGVFAQWDPSGKQIVYIEPEEETVMVVSVAFEGARPILGKPEKSFPVGERQRRFALSPDGERLLMIRRRVRGRPRLEITRNLRVDLPAGPTGPTRQ